MTPSPAAIYSEKWRQQVRAGARSSAEVLAPYLAGRYEPARVIDVGCGEGWFCREFEACGVHAAGVDGPWVDSAITVDFDRPPYPQLGRFDLAVCLEVAEHVEPGAANDFIAWLISLAPVVVFSAAVPGQGGEGHVNEQPPAYWRDLFASHARRGSGALRWAIWDDDRIEPWYRQNLLVFGDPDLVDDGCPHVIHPAMWRDYR